MALTLPRAPQPGVEQRLLIGSRCLLIENRSKTAGRKKSKRAAVTKGAPTTPTTRLRRKIETVGELLHWSYANLAAA
jgi:hypothetical protein